MDRITFKKFEVSDKDVSPTRCPTCGSFPMQVVAGSFQSNLAASCKLHGINPDDWSEMDEYNERYTFSVEIKCHKAGCGEIVRVVGFGSNSPYTGYDEDHGEYDTYLTTYEPLYFHPALEIFPIPTKTPEEIASHIRKSFELFFADPSSSANHVRSALEAFCDNVKVKTFTLTKTKKRHRLTLSDRINHLPVKYRKFHTHLTALKWLGNAGSHGAELSRDDVLDAYEILTSLLNELYEKPNRNLEKLVSSINKKKGPVKRRSGR